MHTTSTKPYLLRALYEWCGDNHYTPYLTVWVDEHVQVPMAYVKNNEIVLNISFDATSGLKLGNDFVEFKARFGGTAREIMVPIDRVIDELGQDVQIEEVSEALAGQIVIDIRHPDAAEGFTGQTQFHRLQVQFPPELLAQVPQADRAALTGVLANDPRPSYQHDPQRVYGMEFAGLEVHFTVDGAQLTVQDITLL